MNNENKSIIKAIDMFGRVPEQWELLEEIENLNNIIKQQDTRNSRQRIANRKLLERNQDLVIENLKLNNIINEFDKWLLGEQMMFYKGSDDERLIRYEETKFKWLELKGVDKD